MENESTTINITNDNIERSDIKKYIEKLYEEIKEVEEDIDNLSKEIEKINQTAREPVREEAWEEKDDVGRLRNESEDDSDDK